jgi:hypothetical protein
MRYILIAVLLGCTSLFITPHAHALSCLPVSDYVDSIIGDEQTVIFTATTNEIIEKSTYTAESITVTAAHQGYVENSLFVYHEKNETWGYLCNNGPKGDSSTGLYIASRDDAGLYQVSQRLDATDTTVIASIKEKIAAKDITGEIVTITTEDRRAQILSSINNLFKKIAQLFGEYTYLKN